MMPSKSAYSTGWSSTWTASRFSSALNEGPLGTAQLFKTPSISRDPGGDDALEVRVLDGMVLDVDGQPLLLGLERGPLGNSPALQDTVHLQAHAVVQATGGVLLDDEHPALAAAGRTEGLGRARRVTLLSVVVERYGHRYPLDIP